MTDTAKNTLSDADWLEEAARYFENRDTGGEDMAFWANVSNSERCRSIAQSLRASIPGGVGVQCCMCGKTGLSTIEGDGGTECQLEDGRWTCSRNCYYTAVDWFSRPALAEQHGEPDAYIDWKTQCAWPAENIKDPTGLQPVWYAAPSNPVISDEWPEPPEGWQRTKPTYGRKDGALRVEFVHGREGTPWCVSMSLGNGACATLSYHATPQEALTAALSVKPQSGSDKP